MSAQPDTLILRATKGAEMTKEQIFKVAYEITEQFMSLDSCDPGANEAMVPQVVQDIVRKIDAESWEKGVMTMLDASIKEVRRRCLAISRKGLQRVAGGLLKTRLEEQGG